MSTTLGLSFVSNFSWKVSSFLINLTDKTNEKVGRGRGKGEEKEEMERE